MEEKIIINLNDVNKIKDFCQLVQELNGHIEVKAGRYVVDGKSLLGMLSLDLSNDLEVYIENNNDKGNIAIIKKLKKFK